MKRIVLIPLCALCLSLTIKAQADQIRVLIAQLHDSKDIYERRKAAKALGEIDAQPRAIAMQVASALLAVALYQDESLQYYAKNALKRVRLSAEDALDVWSNYPYTSLEDLGGEAAVVPLLCELLNKPENLPNRSDPFLRYHTARQLLHLGSAMPDIAVPALIKALRNVNFGMVPGNDYSSEFPSQVAFALGAIGEPAIVNLLEVLRDGESLACIWASIALSVMNPQLPETIVPELLDILVHGNQRSQFCVIDVLERIGEPAKDAVPLLIDFLSDKYYPLPIQRQAVEALGAIGPEASAAVPALIWMLDAYSPRWDDQSATFVLVSVLDALGNIGLAAQVALPNIQKALDDVDFAVRIAAARALRKLSHPLSVSQIKALDDQDEYLSNQVLQEIGKLPPPFQDEAISFLLENGGTATGAFILAQIAEPALPQLLNALTSPNLVVRQTAAKALSEMESLPPHGLAALIKAMQSTEICSYAVQGLARMDSKKATNAVIAALKHEDAEVRLAGAYALAKLDSPSQETQTALIAVLGDKYQPVHRNAVIALRKIGTVEAIKAVDRIELRLK